MKKRNKPIIARTAGELADVLGLEKHDAVAMDFRARLNKKIVDLLSEQRLTHAELARRAKASRTRITAILNGQTLGVSTDFLLRLLDVLGCKTTPLFTRRNRAA